MIPAGSIHQSHFDQEEGPWCKQVLLYSPDNGGDNPDNRIDLYAGEPQRLSDERIIELAKKILRRDIFAGSALAVFARAVEQEATQLPKVEKLQMVRITINGKPHLVYNRPMTYYDVVRLAWGEGDHPLLTVTYASEHCSGLLAPGTNRREASVVPCDNMHFCAVHTGNA
jgi:hypothetical protein